MADFSIRGQIDIDAGPAARALSSVSENFIKIATNARSSDSAVAKAGAGLKDAAAAAKLEAKALADVAVQQQKVNKAYQDARLVSARATGVNVATKNSKAVTAGQVGLLEARATAEGIKAQAMADDTASKIASRNIKDRITLRKEEERAARRVAAADEESFNNLAATRYALYDVSRTLGIAGAAMLALPIASATVAVAWERDFARVQRTFGGTSKEVAALRTDFVNLVQTIPEDWGALTEIGTMAGQLGIAGPQIASFTKVVAQFATTTGVSVDETATAFGRLNSLVPDVNGNYQKLADSVLSVGVNSVATEQQILKISTQLSFLGSQTTFTSEEIIGLAGALASVGVPPELSRGLVARVFGNIGRAVVDGGVKLEKFGAVARMSGDEFRKGWTTDAGATFLRFMKGVAAEGTNAEAALRELGITSIRDVPVLIRLANAADSTGRAGALIAQTFRDATKEVASGELARQYSIQAGTVSAKIQLLINNFQALLDVGGQGGLGALGWILDNLITRLKEITDFAQTDFGNNVIGFGLILSGIAGALLLVGSAAAMSVAGYMALILALKGLQTQAGGAAISMGSLNAMLASTGPMGVKAAAGIRLVGTALKGLYGIGLALVLPDIAKWAGDTVYDLLNTEKTFRQTMDRFTDSYAFNVSVDDDLVRGVREASEAVGFFAYNGQRDLNRIEESFKALAAAGNMEQLHNDMLQFSLATGWTVERIMKEMPGLTDAFREAGIEVKQLSDGTITFTNTATGMTASGEEIAGVLNTIEEEAAATEAAIQEAAAALAGFNGEAMNAEAAEIKFQGALNTIRDAAKEADTAIDGTNDASLKLRQSFLDGEAAARASAQAIIDNGGTVADATAKYNDMRAAIVKEIAAKTGSMDKANEWADRILGTADEAKAAIQGYSDQVNTMPTKKPLTIESNISSVKQGLDGLMSALNAFNGKTYTTRVYTHYGTTGNPNPGIVGDLYRQGSSGGQFYEGGFTGIGGKYQPAGVVHKGEYVMPAYSVQALGTSYFDNIRRATQKGYASGGSVSGVVQGSSTASAYTSQNTSTVLATMDAQSIQALANAIAASPTFLYTTDRLIAESAARGAEGQTQIGTN